MSEYKYAGGPAFPMHPDVGDEDECYGMTMRDYFAAKALQGYMANPTSFGPDVPDEAKHDPEMVAAISARFAYVIADAMLAEREAK